MEDRHPQPRLYRQLNEYCSSDAYPFHMPGHKRRSDTAFMAGFANPYSIDITEIDGFDNLHHAEGLLRESMDWAASVYGAGRTYYLIDGSTCGVLAAVCSSVPRGGTILMARNSHKSAYHAAALNELNIRYIYPQIIDDFGLQGGLLPQDIEKMLISADNGQGEGGEDGCENETASRPSDMPDAVFITSPTYDGVVSDVRGIADVCHRYGVPLIVDEAHGAHFPFGGMFPASALEEGADIVIQSLHKTLPAFTQTALLHVQTDRVDIGRLKYYLQVFQTSSPSYVLMAGIERCIEYMSGEGRDEMKRFAGRLANLRCRLRGLRRLRLLDRDVIGSAGVYDLDGSKIIISAAACADGSGRLTGTALAERLRREYRLEMEMCGADYVTAITTLMDSEEGLRRLEEAFFGIDEGLTDGRPAAAAHQATAEFRSIYKSMEAFSAGRTRTCSPYIRPIPIHEAQARPARALGLEAAVGHVSGEYVYLYPPGIPIVVPGEVLTEDIIDKICTWKRQNLLIQGMYDHTAAEIRVLI